jgi:hypothetical protein
LDAKGFGKSAKTLYIGKQPICFAAPGTPDGKSLHCMNIEGYMKGLSERAHEGKATHSFPDKGLLIYISAGTEQIQTG